MQIIKNSKRINIYKLIFVANLVLSVLAVPFQRAFGASCTITVTNNNDSGSGSFRQSLIDANNATGVDVMCFSIGSGVKTIPVSSSFPFPAITDPVIIDGTTQPGYVGTPLIEINGADAGNVNGLQVSAGSSTLKGLVVNNFYGDGILLDTAGSNVIVGNYVGTDTTGTSEKGNGRTTGASNGIGVLSSNNTIGGSSSADRNVISGNGGNGITIGAGASGNVISGNYIGTNASSTSALPNGADGVLLMGSNNIVGGTAGVTPLAGCAGACNLISGNGANGVGIWRSNATGNVVKGNFIGVSLDGNSALPNADIGLEVQEASNNVIGGTSAAERNVISGNKGAGVSLTGSLSVGNSVVGNFIGTNSGGTAAIGNQKMGVNIGSTDGGSSNAHDNIIGGTKGNTPTGSCSGSCNVISGNGWSGVYISGSNGGANRILGNYIGAGVSGGSTIPNKQDGIGVVDSPTNEIGGQSVCERNIISGNGGNGVAIIGDAPNSSRIENNYIGIAVDRNVMPNAVTGVAVAAGVDTAILNNSIYANGFLGIDLSLGGVSPNDTGDSDSGPNRLQNFPALTSASAQNGAAMVVGSLNSNASTTYRIDFFSNPKCSQYKNGQGYQFLGKKNVTTDAAGNVDFVFQSTYSVQNGYSVTATATKTYNGVDYETSEFSSCVTYSGSSGQGTPSVASDEDRIYNWAEKAYPQTLAPASSSQCLSGYYLRYYSATNTYLGSKNGRLYFYAPRSNSPQVRDLGNVEDYLPQALSAGF